MVDESWGLNEFDETEENPSIDLAERETEECPRNAHDRLTLPNIITKTIYDIPLKQCDPASFLLLAVELFMSDGRMVCRLNNRNETVAMKKKIYTS